MFDWVLNTTLKYISSFVESWLNTGYSSHTRYDQDFIQQTRICSKSERAFEIQGP